MWPKGALGFELWAPLAVSAGPQGKWVFQEALSLSLAGVFHLGVPVEGLFFVGSQLIATSHTGKIGVWNAVTKHWQVGVGSTAWGAVLTEVNPIPLGIPGSLLYWPCLDSRVESSGLVVLFSLRVLVIFERDSWWLGCPRLLCRVALPLPSVMVLCLSP